jgi:hypothetical protein
MVCISFGILQGGCYVSHANQFIRQEGIVARCRTDMIRAVNPNFYRLKSNAQLNCKKKFEMLLRHGRVDCSLKDVSPGLLLILSPLLSEKEYVRPTYT